MSGTLGKCKMDTFCSVFMKGGDQSGDVGVDGIIILKWILKKQGLNKIHPAQDTDE
jgi:hypothetical protein